MTGAEFHGVDIDLLADYVGGALDGTPESERVAGLIAADPGWQEAYQLLAPEMATIGALLGDLPAEPMPDDVVARLDAALAHQVAGNGSAKRSEGAAESVPQTVVDLGERRRKRGNNRWTRFAAPVGIAAGIVGLAGYGLFGQTHDSATDSGAASKAAAEGAADATVVAAPAATTASGINYSLGTLGQMINRASSPAGESFGAEQTQTFGEGFSGEEADLERLRDPQALLDCLDAIARENAGGPLTVSAVDYARFEGDPALVVRFTAANGEWAWASGADCGLAGGGADTLGSVPVR